MISMSKSTAIRLELRVLDNSLHDLIVELRREGAVDTAKRLLRIKNYAIRAYVAMSDECETRLRCATTREITNEREQVPVEEVALDEFLSPLELETLRRINREEPIEELTLERINRAIREAKTRLQ